MKKILMIGAAVASALAVPAGAQTLTGTINITGTVATKCSIIGGANATTFTDNVNLGELSQADGTLEQSATLSNRFKSTTTNQAPAFRVACNTAAPRVSVDANELTTAGAAANGYANRVDYIARVAVGQANGGAVNISNQTTQASATTQVVGALSGGAQNNFTVTADTFTTPTANAVMVAGNYTGNIVITVTPS